MTTGNARSPTVIGLTTPKACVARTNIQQLRKRPLKPLRPRPPAPAQCAFSVRDKRATNRGLCPAHAKQRRKGQPLRPLRPFYGTEGSCRFDGCSKPRAAGGFCVGHAAQYYSGRRLAPLFTQDRMRLPWLVPNAISLLAIARVIGDNFENSGRLHRCVSNVDGDWIVAM